MASTAARLALDSAATRSVRAMLMYAGSPVISPSHHGHWVGDGAMPLTTVTAMAELSEVSTAMAMAGLRPVSLPLAEAARNANMGASVGSASGSSTAEVTAYRPSSPSCVHCGMRPQGRIVVSPSTHTTTSSPVVNGRAMTS